MKQMKKLSLGILTLSLLASCGGTSETHAYPTHCKITIQNPHGTDKVVKPEEVTLSESFHSLQDRMQFNTRVLPSEGDVKMLVIPVLLPGYEEIDLDKDGKDDSALVRRNIQDCFFGDSEKTGYESVSSYYEKSSYGKLHLSGKVTPWFYLSEESSLEYQSAAQITISETYNVVDAAVKWVKESGEDMTQYDYDGDGYLDGVWVIYSAPDYVHGGPQTDDMNFWAYTSWGNQTEVNGQGKPNVNDPVYNLFGWASYDFMYENYGTEKLDAHTYIHETGHFLGLSDYYTDTSFYNPIGKVDMMDGNIIDQNSFSKMLLGWTKPYIVTGSGSVDLYSMENENSCIVIPFDDADIGDTFNPFSEYLLVELYTPEGLNEADSKNKLGSSPIAMNQSGVRIYHVNKTLYYTSPKGNLFTAELYQNQKLDKNHHLIAPITNNRGADMYNYYFGLDMETNLFDEIRLIEADGENTFSNGGYQKNKSLFMEGSSFSMSQYGEAFFLNGTTFDYGQTYSGTIQIGGIR